MVGEQHAIKPVKRQVVRTSELMWNPVERGASCRWGRRWASASCSRCAFPGQLCARAP